MKQDIISDEELNDFEYVCMTLETPLEENLKMKYRCEKQGIKTVLNLSPYQPSISFDFLRNIDIVLFNEGEHDYFMKAYKSFDSRALMKIFGFKQMIVTLGEKGVKLFYQDKEFYDSGYQVDVVDTTGAGDAFLTGYLSALCKEIHPEEALKYGQLCACLCIT